MVLLISIFNFGGQPTHKRKLFKRSFKTGKAIVQVDGNSLSSLHGGCSSLLCVFSLASAHPLKSLWSTSSPPVNKSLAILVHFQLANDNIARVNTNIDSGAISLLSLDTLNVNTVLGSVALDDLANLLSLEVTTGYLNLIILTDGKTADSVLCFQFLTQGRGHDKPANVRRSLEVTLAQLPCLDGDRPVHFTMIDHFLSCRSESSNISLVKWYTIFGTILCRKIDRNK